MDYPNQATREQAERARRNAIEYIVAKNGELPPGYEEHLVDGATWEPVNAPGTHVTIRVGSDMIRFEPVRLPPSYQYVGDLLPEAFVRLFRPALFDDWEKDFDLNERENVPTREESLEALNDLRRAVGCPLPSRTRSPSSHAG